LSARIFKLPEPEINTVNILIYFPINSQKISVTDITDIFFCLENGEQGTLNRDRLRWGPHSPKGVGIRGEGATGFGDRQEIFMLVRGIFP
jgi:hypothetical protein